jgi:hypothetical protein
LREIFAQQRVRIEREQRAGGVAVHGEQPRVLQGGEAAIPVFLRQADERFGEAGDGGRFEQGLQAVGGRGPVKEAHEGEEGEFAPRFLAAVGQPFLVGRHGAEGVAVVGLLVGLGKGHAVAAADVALEGALQERTHEVQREGVAVHVFDELFKLAELFAMLVAVGAREVPAVAAGDAVGLEQLHAGGAREAE